MPRESGGRGIGDVYEGGGGELMIDESTNVYLWCNKQKGVVDMFMILKERVGGVPR
jgi:hypothetical protein